MYDVDIYLDFFAASVVWGDANCQNLGGTESTVCTYMTNKANHDIFASGYPKIFLDVWDWLKVSNFSAICEMQCSQGSIESQTV